MRSVHVTIVPLTVVAVVTLAMERGKDGLSNMRLKLTVGVVVVVPMSHLYTVMVGMGGSGLVLVRWMQLMLLLLLIGGAAIVITASQIATTTANSMLILGTDFEKWLRLIASQFNLLLCYPLEFMLQKVIYKG